MQALKFIFSLFKSKPPNLLFEGFGMNDGSFSPSTMGLGF